MGLKLQRLVSSLHEKIPGNDGETAKKQQSGGLEQWKDVNKSAQPRRHSNKSGWLSGEGNRCCSF